MLVWQTKGMQSLWHSRKGLVDIEGKEIAAKHCTCEYAFVCVRTCVLWREGDGGRMERSEGGGGREVVR